MVLTKLKLHDILQRVTEWEENRIRRIKEQNEDLSSVRSNTNNPRSRRNNDDATGNELGIEVMATNDANQCCDLIDKGIDSRRKSPEIFFDSSKGEISDLKGLVSHNEIFDTPVAIDISTPGTVEQSDEGDESNFTRLSERISTNEYDIFRKNNNFFATERANNIEHLELLRSKLTDGIQHQEGPSCSKTILDKEDTLEETGKTCNSPDAKTAISQAACSSQIILPSNLNHYPNIFELDDDLDESDDESCPFSFHQEDPTQAIVKGKRKRNEILESFDSFDKEKLLTSQSIELTNNTEKGNVRKNVPIACQVNSSPDVDNCRNSVATKLNKFKFRKVFPQNRE